MTISNYVLSMGVDGTLTILPGQVDSTSTDLAFVGVGGKEYGRHYASNFMKLLTNFASTSTPPTHPKQGQLWYKSSTKQMRIFTSDGWKEIYSEGSTSSAAIGIGQGGTGLLTLGSPGYVLRVSSAGTELEYAPISSVLAGSYLKSDGTSVPTADNSFNLGASGARFNTVHAVTFSGNSTSSDRWANARTLSFIGDATGSVSFDGSGNSSVSLTHVDTGVTAGNYTKVAVDSKGRVTTGAQLSNPDVVSGLGYPPVSRTGDTMTGALTIATTNAGIALAGSSTKFISFNNSANSVTQSQISFTEATSELKMLVLVGATLTPIVTIGEDGLDVSGRISSSLDATASQHVPRWDQTKTMAPSGMIGAFASLVPPTGWLKANGATVSRALYAELFSVIGTSYNTGGETLLEFRLPDLRGDFIRGWDDGRGVDVGRGFGSQQPSYAGSFTWQIRNDDGDGETGSYRSVSGVIIGGEQVYAYDYGGNSFSPVKTTYVTPGDTRPRNVALLYCIKY